MEYGLKPSLDRFTYHKDGAEGGPSLVAKHRLGETLNEDEHVGHTDGKRQHGDDQVALKFTLKSNDNN